MFKWLINIISWIVKLFKKDDTEEVKIEMKHFIKEVGLLTVFGKNQIDIHLPRSEKPREVVVNFTNYFPPCSPGTHDHLGFKLKRDYLKHKYYLEIKWQVQSVREIEWLIYY